MHGAAYLDELAQRRARQDRLARSRHLLLAGHAGTPRARPRARPASSRPTCSTARWRSGIAVVRPPGHHATRDQRDGLLPAQQRRGGRRGGARAAAPRASRSSTGTSTTATARRTSSGTIRAVLYLSVHQYPYYPGTGAPTEIGGASAHGRDDQRRPAARLRRRRLRRGVRPRVRARARRSSSPTSSSSRRASTRSSTIRSPACASRTPGSPRWRGGCARSPSARRGGRIVAVLEGGYDLDGLAGGMTGVLAALARPAQPPPGARPAARRTSSRGPRSRARSPRTPPRASRFRRERR